MRGMVAERSEGIRAALGRFGDRLARHPGRWRVTLAQHSLFPPTWHNSPRCLDEHLVFLITRGHGWIRLFDQRGRDRAEHLFEPGTLLWMPPGVWHATGTLEGSEAVGMYHLRFRLAGSGFQTAAGWDYAAVPRARDTTPLVEGFIAAHRRGGDDRERELQAWLQLILSALRRGLEPDRPKGLDDDQQRRIERHVQRHLHRELDSEQLARVVKLTRVYFARLFKASYGMAPRSWIVQQRLQRAAILLLETPLAVRAVAEELGYRSLPLFSRQFKKAHGVSPEHFRRNHRRGGFASMPMGD